ncbi:unnamed protein product [Agarophyton chilense]
MNVLQKLLLYVIVLSTAAICACGNSSPRQLSMVKRVENFHHEIRQAVSVDEERNSSVLQDFTLFFGPIGQGVINVRSGLSASFRFDYRIQGVTSRYLAESDQVFRSSLDQHEKILYDESKRRYDGGLDIPFLSELGMNLSHSHSESALQEAMSVVENYSKKAIAARRIMESFHGARLRINGSISAVGVSEMPSRASVYVKVSRVTLIDETVLHVVSSNTNDILAGDGFYNELPIVDIDSDIIQEVEGNPLLL